MANSLLLPRKQQPDKNRANQNTHELLAGRELKLTLHRAWEKHKALANGVELHQL
jgi:hypothetical protein